MQKNIKRLSALMAASALLMIASACGNSGEPTASTPSADAAVAGNQTTANAPKAATSGEATSSADTGETVYPLTVSNYGSDWKSLDQTFDKVPERVVANTQGVTELLLELGLAERIVGTAAAYGEPYPEVAEDYAKVPVLVDDYANKELVLGARPDFIVGRGELFADEEWGHGTVKDLNAIGIKTYMQHASRPGTTMDDLFTDIEQFGKIFNVQKRASEFGGSLKERLDSVSAKLDSVDKERTFAFMLNYDGNSASLFAGESVAYQNDAVKRLKLVPATNEMGDAIGAEKLLAINPDVILYVDFLGSELANPVDKIYANKAFQDINAVKNKQIFVIQYNTFMTYSFNIVDGIEALAKEMYPEQMGE